MSSLRHESLAGGRVKGAMVRAHLQFIREQLGEPALALTLKALPLAVAAEVQGILASTWCTFESLVVLDRTIARVAGRDERELMRELGRYSARINLSTIYRAFIATTFTSSSATAPRCTGSFRTSAIANTKTWAKGTAGSASATPFASVPPTAPARRDISSR